MKKREFICALVAGAAMLDVIGLFGSVDVGSMTMGECIPRAIGAVVVAVIAVVVGESAEEKKKAAPDGNQDSGSNT